MKLQTSNFKLQESIKPQTSKPPARPPPEVWSFKFGAFLKFDVWSLKFLFGTLLICIALIPGCGGRANPSAKQNRDFFTSGSKEADQRASQRMARDEQLTGSGEGAGEKKVKKATAAPPSPTGRAPNASQTNRAAQVTDKLALFDRLGGQAGISNLVADFMPRALQDPRVNWDRRDVSRNVFRRGENVAWHRTPNTIALLQTHLVEFIALATGGPAHYEGKEIKSAHADMKISNPEFDAVVGDLKVSLDRLQIPNKEQKELLAIIESTRPQIVTER